MEEEEIIFKSKKINYGRNIDSEYEIEIEKEYENIINELYIKKDNKN